MRTATPPQVSQVMTRLIPSSKEALPVIGIGTWKTFDVGQDRAARVPLETVLEDFVANGGKLVDTSPMYGDSEAVLGELTADLGLRSRLFIATKVWTMGRKAGIDQMRDSLRKLRVDQIDLMQVHNLVDVRTHLDTLRAWKEEGRVRYIGVTHYTASYHDDVARIMEAQPLDFIQINYSVTEREAEARLLPLARERGVAVIANRPFAGGALLRRLRDRPLPSWASELGCATWPQLLLKYVLAHPAITCVIPATSSAVHVRDNLHAAREPLPDETLRVRIVAAVTQ